MIENLFYFANINSIGGVETFFYNLSRTHGNITVLYKTGDPERVRRLAERVQVIRFNGNPVRCRRAFFNYACDVYESIDADERYQIIHADYKKQNLKPDERISNYIAVSKAAAEHFKEATGKTARVIYNPVYIDEPKKVLRLVSATRLTPEKGAERMKRAADILDKKGIPFVWQVFTNNTFQHESILTRKPCLNVIDYIKDADYLVQLSDTEAFCFSVAEALTVGTPVIVTPCPVYEEIGVNKDNAIILPFDFDDIDETELYKKRKFKYSAPAETWGELLTGKATYDPGEKVNVLTIKNYFDIEKQRQILDGEEQTVTASRAAYLEAVGVVKRTEPRHA